MIKEYIQAHQCTQLCVGPMSKNCIDAAIELSEQFAIPMVLIASRRQVDSEEFGGGYVENYTTQNFCQYVRSKRVHRVYIARDHGGPWQSVYEVNQNMSASEAMRSAKKSFCDDIDAGFDFIHIDPSVPIQKEELTIQTILSRLFELYGFCDEYAKQRGRDVEFELGTEEQNGYGQDLGKFEYFLQEVFQFCKKNKVKKPMFVVAQTGTKVMETKNVGIFKNDIESHQKLSLDHLRNTLKICQQYGVFLKEHNTDYLNNEALKLRPLIGIHASNVAPEFGVAETKALLYLLSANGLRDEWDVFVDHAIQSKKWVKWVLPDTTTTEVEKAIICGHYIFSHSMVMDIKSKLSQAVINQGIGVDDFLKKIIRQSMLRYIHLFGMV